MNRTPKIYRLPVSSLGTHETLVLIIDGVSQSVETWNYVENKDGTKTFYIVGVTEWQITVRNDAFMSVIRASKD